MKITFAELNASALAGSPTRPFSFKEKQKLFYFLSVLIFTCLNAYLFGSMMQQHASVWSALIFAAIFFCVGLIHIFLFPAWMPSAKALGLNRNIFYSIAMAAIIAIASLVIFWSNGFHLLSLCFIAAVSFLLPALVMECFHLYTALPTANYQPWIFPQSNIPEKKMSLLLNSTLFKIHVQLKRTDERATLFNITLPRKLTVDAVFQHFFYDHKDDIELYQNGQPYGWYFSIKKWYGNKALDPHLSLAENGIKEDEIIYAKRVYTATNN